MAFSSSIVLKDNAGTNRSFVELKRAGSRVERLDTATTPQLPKRFIIDHSIVNTANGVTDRHLLQMAQTVNDVTGKPVTTVVNLTISVPRTAPDMNPAKHAIAALADMLLTTGVCNTSFDAILRGES